MFGRILVVRLGAMGDIIHALPAVATLRRAFPDARLTWLVEPRWRTLLEGGGVVDEIAEFDRQGGLAAMWRSARALVPKRFDLAIDFQGLIKSAAALRFAAPTAVRWGSRNPREAAARGFYSRLAVVPSGSHIVEQHLALARAAGALEPCLSFPLPPGRAEGSLPEGRFVLASPLAGWVSKQWPMENYGELGRLLRDELGVPLVLNLAPGAEAAARAAGPSVMLHVSGIPGLIDATRRAAAVLGVDSGPLHLAAALDKPGVALFGPTDPGRNGPFGGSLTVIRTRNAETSYRRGAVVHPSMLAISPAEVFTQLRSRLPF